MSYYSVISLPEEFINFQNAFASFDVLSSSWMLEHICNVVDGLQAQFVRDNKVWQRKTVLRVADRMVFYIAFDLHDVSYEFQMNIFSSFANCFNNLLKNIEFLRDSSSCDDKLIDNSRYDDFILFCYWYRFADSNSSLFDRNSYCFSGREEKRKKHSFNKTSHIKFEI